LLGDLINNKKMKKGFAAIAVIGIVGLCGTLLYTMQNLKAGVSLFESE
jgi:hypothetical protein